MDGGRVEEAVALVVADQRASDVDENKQYDDAFLFSSFEPIKRQNKERKIEEGTLLLDPKASLSPIREVFETLRGQTEYKREGMRGPGNEVEIPDTCLITEY